MKKEKTKLVDKLITKLDHFHNSERGPTKTSTACASDDGFWDGGVDDDCCSDHVSYYDSNFWYGIAIRQNGTTCGLCNRLETGNLIYWSYIDDRS